MNKVKILNISDIEPVKSRKIINGFALILFVLSIGLIFYGSFIKDLVFLTYSFFPVVVAATIYAMGLWRELDYQEWKYIEQIKGLQTAYLAALMQSPELDESTKKFLISYLNDNRAG